MDLVKLKELNSSFTQMNFNETTESQGAKKQLCQTLMIERPGWQYDYLVKIGKKSKYDLFYNKVSDNTIIVNTGVLEVPPIREFLGLPEMHEQETPDEVDTFLEHITESGVIPFDPYPYQLEACRKALTKQRKLNIMCTGSGKSLTISLCLEFFRQKNLKGVLVVPNINLLKQFASDIKSYNLLELHDSIITFGGDSKSIKQMKDPGSQLIGGQLVITTWQSLSKLGPKFFNSIDYIICDEVHRFSSECTSNLVEETQHARYKLGFTGTLPDAKSQKMKLIGLFGVPEVIITSSELIDDGKGTPIKITAVKIKHTLFDSVEIQKNFEYLDKVKYLASIPDRTQLISNIARKMSAKSMGSTLILFTLIEHGTQLYQDIAGEAPSSLERMKELGVYFMSGTTTGSQREEIRGIMDDDPSAILVANYALLSTGVNIKSLRFAIFASPVKSGVTVAQSLGRGIRLSDNKEEFNVFDIVDLFKGSGTFRSPFSHRKKIYAKLGFSMDEREVHFKEPEPPVVTFGENW